MDVFATILIVGLAWLGSVAWAILSNPNVWIAVVAVWLVMTSVHRMLCLSLDATAHNFRLANQKLEELRELIKKETT